jgi:hypothetical protein
VTPPDRFPARLLPMDLEGVRVRGAKPWAPMPSDAYGLVSIVHYILSDRPTDPPRVAMVDHHWFEPYGDERRDRGESGQERIADAHAKHGGGRGDGVRADRGGGAWLT